MNAEKYVRLGMNQLFFYHPSSIKTPLPCWCFLFRRHSAGMISIHPRRLWENVRQPPPKVEYQNRNGCRLEKSNQKWILFAGLVRSVKTRRCASRLSEGSVGARRQEALSRVLLKPRLSGFTSAAAPAKDRKKTPLWRCIKAQSLKKYNICRTQLTR